MADENLEKYINYYLKLRAPGYAVLITGDWGVGKTYQTLNLIPDELRCHVSLFGIKETTEIYTTVFSKMYPGKSLAKKAISLTKDATSEIQGITFGAGTIIGNVLNSIIKETVDTSKVIIFDDLERCSLDNREILGVINKYVEHHLCHVIVLAHDEKTQNEFNFSKEKIIGHTIKISPQINDAAIVFFESTKNLNNFGKIKPIIIDSFKKTECKSLRILKHVINDCNRLLNCLETRHIRNIEAMKILFSNFTIMNTDFRRGLLSADNVKNTIENYYDYAISKNNFADKELDENKKRLVSFFRRYSEQDIMSFILDYKLMSIMFEYGNYPKKNIQESVNSSRYFIRYEKSPAWLNLLQFDILPDELVNKSIKEVINDLDKKEITDIGAMLHTFHMLFLITKNRVINESFETLTEKLKIYIDELLSLGLLPPTPINASYLHDDIYQASYGHKYWVQDDYQEYIDEIIEYLRQKRDEAFKSQYNIFEDEILFTLEKDISTFKTLFLGKGGEIGKYSQIDILSSISVDDFLIRWFLLPIEQWDQVRLVLNSRYRNISNEVIKNEKNWLYELCITMKMEAMTLSGLEKLRIERLIPYPAIKNLQAY